MLIAIDAMGGDLAPSEIVAGAVQGARQYDVGIILAGPADRIQLELERYDTAGLDIEISHTDEYLLEGEHPAFALRKKRNASIMLASKLVREGRAQAVVGAGPTGGIFAAALQVLGTLEGLSRPVIGGPFLGFAPQTILIDMGGNVDSRPDQLLDFAVIGLVYARQWMGIDNPTVALLSNGKEEGKGNNTVKAAYPLFKQSGLNFIGNLEGDDIVDGKANVIICDGFVGNILCKFCEGLGNAGALWLKKALDGMIPPEKIQAITQQFIKATNPAQTAGGGPLWGVNGVVCKAHGHSNADQIALTIAAAKKAVEINLVGNFQRELETIKKTLDTNNLKGD
jgi:glycerol-3-phosphate acyltransferase PlsX